MLSHSLAHKSKPSNAASAPLQLPIQSDGNDQDCRMG